MGDYGDWRAIIDAHDPVKSSHALRIFFQHLSEQQHVPLSETSVEKSSWIHASQNFFFNTCLSQRVTLGVPTLKKNLSD